MPAEGWVSELGAAGGSVQQGARFRQPLVYVSPGSDGGGGALFAYSISVLGRS